MKNAIADTTAVKKFWVRSRFAECEVEPADVITFPDGLPGYEACRSFVLLDREEAAPLKYLHAVNAEEPCFLTIDPTQVLPTYRCALSAADRLRLGVADGDPLVWLATVIVGDTGDLSVNLRAPIVINAAKMIGRQVMPNNCVYPLYHRISDDV